MEKICLVKLRKKIINPLLSQGEQGIVSQGSNRRVPQQFFSSYVQPNIINNGVSDNQGKELGTAPQFISSFTNDAINDGASANAEIERGGARQCSAPFADNEIIPREPAHVVTLADNKNTVPGETVSLKLTQEQIKTIRSNSSLMSVFNGDLFGGSAELNYRDEPVTIKFEFEPLAPVRLLMPEEVIQMLRISNGYLKTIVRDGRLKSYKIGKGRRYMLEDVLSYLQESLKSYASPQDTLRAETI